MKNKIIALALMFLSLNLFQSFKVQDDGLKIGAMAPEFVMKDINGREVKLSDYKGKIVLIDFWASWCKQSRIESPRLVKVYQKYKNTMFQTGQGFEIISIALDEDPDDWRTAVKEDGFTWANVSEGKKWDAAVAVQYGVTSLPANYLIDGTGKIFEKNVKGPQLDNILMSLRK